MESSHRRIINELEKKHQQELQTVLCEKEQALAEETQVRIQFNEQIKKNNIFSLQNSLIILQNYLF